VNLIVRGDLPSPLTIPCKVMYRINSCYGGKIE